MENRKILCVKRLKVKPICNKCKPVPDGTLSNFSTVRLLTVPRCIILLLLVILLLITIIINPFYEEGVGDGKKGTPPKEKLWRPENRVGTEEGNPFSKIIPCRQPVTKSHLIFNT